MLYITLLGGLSTPAVSYVIIVVGGLGFCSPPLRSYYCSQYYIQVADCTVEFSYVYMLYVILYYIVYVNQPRARNWRAPGNPLLLNCWDCHVTFTRCLCLLYKVNGARHSCFN